MYIYYIYIYYVNISCILVYTSGLSREGALKGSWKAR